MIWPAAQPCSPCSMPRHEILIFFQDASLLSYFLPPSDPSLYIPITHSIDDYLQNSPLTSITGFWADLHWKWPGQADWVQTIQANQEQEFHATLTPSPTPHRHSSKDMMFTEWEADITPLPCSDPRRHYPLLTDPPSIELHPFTKGVLSAGSRKLQSAVFQIATGHCFDASYSTRFCPSADDHTDCPHCGEPYTITHVLDDGNCYIIECQEGNLTDTLAHGFMLRPQRA
jgi:hypothetical protein